MKNGRYLLFIDILGFTNLVDQKDPEAIYAVLDSALQSFERWEELNQLFGTIYFSDTFLFYQIPKGYGDRAFLDVYAIGARLLSALLAQGIPARGSITFGEFEVRNDTSNKHRLFFGKALVEAYKSEKRENWIGITIQPSAWKPFEAANSGVVAVFESERVWRSRADGVLLLNPFSRLYSWYVDDLIGEIDRPYTDWDQPEFPNDIAAFKFLRDKASEYAVRGDFSGREAVKYHATITFLKDILGQDIYEWGIKISG